jgi:hypothetical protein
VTLILCDSGSLQVQARGCLRLFMFCLQYVYKQLSRASCYESDLVHMEGVKCVVSGGAETYPIFKIVMNYILLYFINALNAELNPICHFLALLGDHHTLHVSRIRIKCIC